MPFTSCSIARPAPLRAVIDGEALTLRRTAATSLLAARHLARRDARNALIIGTGTLAPIHGACARAGVPARAPVDLGSARRRRRRRWRSDCATKDCRRRRSTISRRPFAVPTSISCATTSTQPIVRGAWLSAGHAPRSGRRISGAACARPTTRRSRVRASSSIPMPARWPKRRTSSSRSSAASSSAIGDRRRTGRTRCRPTAAGRERRARSRSSSRSALRSPTWRPPHAARTRLLTRRA